MPSVPHPYQPVGPVLVRASTYDLDSPTLPDSEAAQDGLAWLGAQWVQPELRDAITVASPDLGARVDQLLTVEKPDARAVRRAVTATASYLRRWQRRATPQRS